MKVYIIISIFKYIWIILNIGSPLAKLFCTSSCQICQCRERILSIHSTSFNDSTRPVSWCLTSSNKLIKTPIAYLEGILDAYALRFTYASSTLGSSRCWDGSLRHLWTTACLKNDAGDPCHHQSLYTIPTLADGMETYGNSERDRDGKFPISKTQRKVAHTESQIQMLLSRHISKNPPCNWGTLYHLYISLPEVHTWRL